jgi:hypothetical protein
MDATVSGSDIRRARCICGIYLLLQMLIANPRSFVELVDFSTKMFKNSSELKTTRKLA